MSGILIVASIFVDAEEDDALVEVQAPVAEHVSIKETITAFL